MTGNPACDVPRGQILLQQSAIDVLILRIRSEQSCESVRMRAAAFLKLIGEKGLHPEGVEVVKLTRENMLKPLVPQTNH